MNANEKFIADYLIKEIGNIFGAFGLMGNIKSESNCNPTNLQNSCEKRLGMTDMQYTAAVDNGTYGNFVKDSAGYGLAQWTYWTRKQNLLNHARNMGTSIGDLRMQLSFLIKELKGYKTVWNKLINAKSIREASDAVLTGYEKPANQSEAVKISRAKNGENYYKDYLSLNNENNEKVDNKPVDKVNNSIKVDSAKSFSKSFKGTYKINTSKCKGLNLRNKATVEKSEVLKVLNANDKVENYGYYTKNGDTKWLYVKIGNITGFVSYNYLTRVK